MKQKMIFSLAFILLNLTAIGLTTAQADDLKIAVGEQSAENKSIARPSTGMKKNLVLEKFGQPLKEKPSVGKPPISSFEYELFTVYFESDYVINTVLKPIKHETKEVHVDEEVEVPESSLKLKEK